MYILCFYLDKVFLESRQTMVTIVSVGPKMVASFQDTRGRENQILGFWGAHSDSISVAGSDGAPARSYPLGTKLSEVTAMQEGKSMGRLLSCRTEDSRIPQKNNH